MSWGSLGVVVSWCLDVLTNSLHAPINLHSPIQPQQNTRGKIERETHTHTPSVLGLVGVCLVGVCVLVPSWCVLVCVLWGCVLVVLVVLVSLHSKTQRKRENLVVLIYIPHLVVCLGGVVCPFVSCDFLVLSLSFCPLSWVDGSFFLWLSCLVLSCDCVVNPLQSLSLSLSCDELFILVLALVLVLVLVLVLSF